MQDYLVILTPEELKFADDLGFRIAQYHEQTGTRHKFNLGIVPFERRVTMSQQGTRAAAALFKFLGGAQANVFWETRVGSDRKTEEIIHSNQPYDAKGISPNSYALIAAGGSVHPLWRYVLVGVEFCPRCYLKGWVTGEDIRVRPLQERGPGGKGRPAHFIDQGDPLFQDCGLLIGRKPSPNLIDLMYAAEGGRRGCEEPPLIVKDGKFVPRDA